MLRDVTIISARRAYEFRTDGVRLSMLTTPQLQDRLRQALGFRAVAVATPPPTFGPLNLTNPPGLVLQQGSVLDDSGQIIPIRFVHFEPHRLVLDIAAPSPYLAELYRLLREMLGDFVAPDDTPLLSEPLNVREFSELSVTLDFEPLDIIAPTIRGIIASAAGPTSSLASVEPAVALTVQHLRGEQIFDGPSGDSTTLQLAPRAGEMIANRRYYSAAPLDTEAHVEYLTELGKAIANSGRASRSTERSKSVARRR